MEILLPHIFIVWMNETKGFSGFSPTLPQFRGKTLIFRFILYRKKITDTNTCLALRSLTYFEDAENQPIPKMYSSMFYDLK